MLFTYSLSTPDQMTVSKKANKLLNFVHTYDILNRGPSPLFNGTIHICIPVYNQEGKKMVSRDSIKVNGTFLGIMLFKQSIKDC